jgi:hypothetical protein
MFTGDADLTGIRILVIIFDQAERDLTIKGTELRFCRLVGDICARQNVQEVSK